MVHVEQTNNRPKEYSVWHRTIPSIYMVDGDWFEMRSVEGIFQPVAYIETIQVHNNMDDVIKKYPVWHGKSILLDYISQKMEIPSLVVYHNPECTSFVVLDWKTKEHARMDRDEYICFLKRMGVTKMETKQQDFESMTFTEVVGDSSFVKLETNEKLTGVYIEKEPSQFENGGFVYTIETQDKKQNKIAGAVLDSKFEHIKVGTIVQIKAIGIPVGKKYMNYKVYTVETQEKP